MRLIISTVTTVVLLASVAAYSEILEGKVMSVSDGDTITILDRAMTQRTLRMNLA